MNRRLLFLFSQLYGQSELYRVTIGDNALKSSLLSTSYNEEMLPTMEKQLFEVWKYMNKKFQQNDQSVMLSF